VGNSSRARVSLGCSAAEVVRDGRDNFVFAFQQRLLQRAQCLATLRVARHFALESRALRFKAKLERRRIHVSIVIRGPPDASQPLRESLTFVLCWRAECQPIMAISPVLAASASKRSIAGSVYGRFALLWLSRGPTNHSKVKQFFEQLKPSPIGYRRAVSQIGG
jgi:hypothetical protein